MQRRLVLPRLSIHIIKMRFIILAQLFFVSCLCDTSTINTLDIPSDYNPDKDLTTPEIISRHGYASESHTILTRDGYFLTLHRIPSSKTGVKGEQPVFLQHGLLSSSVDWVTAGNKSLGFILADQGYDVWLGNARGNIYSRAHLWKSINSEGFWNFSWHEMGVYDVPAVITYITQTTGKEGEILYIGHSMGTTMFFVYSSLYPAESSKAIKAMVGLAPTAYLNHVKSPIRYLTPYVNAFHFLTKNLGLNQFLPSYRTMKLLSYNCNWYINRALCKNIFFLLNGFDEEEFDETLLPVILGHVPAGTSTKTIVHFMQVIANKKNKFTQFDYGEEKNMLIYNRTTPPSYYVGFIKVPMYLVYGKNDWLTTPEDVLKLRGYLTNEVELYEVPIKSFNHVDFLWGKHAPQIVYEPVIEFLGNFTLN